ncbi:type VI secretion system tube protein TssD [Fulvivirga maritima]|uniref:type VI secretion system tube protein TssD n=1 Tax=Fulvivirga maritima TaxID=2904247 RepID=UPI00351DAC7F
MGIIAKLYFEENSYNIIEAEYGIRQRIDESGKPSSTPIFNGLKVVIEASKDNIFSSMPRRQKTAFQN